MYTPSGYFLTGDKLSKVTEDGLRINVYPNGIVTSQLPGQTHQAYVAGLPSNLSSMTHEQASEYLWQTALGR